MCLCFACLPTKSYFWGTFSGALIRKHVVQKLHLPVSICDVIFHYSLWWQRGVIPVLSENCLVSGVPSIIRWVPLSLRYRSRSLHTKFPRFSAFIAYVTHYETGV